MHQEFHIKPCRKQQAPLLPAESPSLRLVHAPALACSPMHGAAPHFEAGAWATPLWRRHGTLVTLRAAPPLALPLITTAPLIPIPAALLWPPSPLPLRATLAVRPAAIFISRAAAAPPLLSPLVPPPFAVSAPAAVAPLITAPAAASATCGDNVVSPGGAKAGKQGKELPTTTKAHLLRPIALPESTNASTE